MNKILIASALLLSTLFYSACKKDFVVFNDDEVSAPPSAYVQKVLLEENTGEWCGWCPDGAAVMAEILNANPRNVIGVAIHDGDPMEVTDYNEWQTDHTGVGGFPNGSIQRAFAVGRGSWNSNTIEALKATPSCGLAIKTNAYGTTLSIDVHVGYNNAINSESRLTVLIVEDKVPQSQPGAQSNYTSINTGQAWLHQHVLRGCLTNVEGNRIDLTDTDQNQRILSFNDIDLRKYNILNTENCKVIAFVHVNERVAGSFKNVLNVQSVAFNKTKNWN